MFAQVALKGKHLFKNRIQTEGQKSIIRSVFVLVEGNGAKEPRVKEEGHVSNGEKLSCPTVLSKASTMTKGELSFLDK